MADFELLLKIGKMKVTLTENNRMFLFELRNPSQTKRGKIMVNMAVLE